MSKSKDSLDDFLGQIDEEDHSEHKSPTKDFSHLNLFQVLMNKMDATKKRRTKKRFLPKDLGAVDDDEDEDKGQDSTDQDDQRGKNESVRNKTSMESPNSNTAEPASQGPKLSLVQKILAAKQNKVQPKEASSPEPEKPFGKAAAAFNGNFGMNLFKDILKLKSSKTQDSEDAEQDDRHKTWRLCVFEVPKKQYHVFGRKDFASSNIPVSAEEETLIVCVNFSNKELKLLLLNKLKVNPVMFYECMLLSTVDKVFEFNGRAVFYNIVVSRDVVDTNPIVIRVIRMESFAVVVVNEYDDESFKVPDAIAKKFDFAEVPSHSVLQVLNINKRPALGDYQSSNASVGSDDEGEVEITKGEIGKIIIQKMKTFKPEESEEVTIDYILFWLLSKGLKKIELQINGSLLREVNAIQDESTNPTDNNKLRFLRRMDVFENRFIGAQNAKESKRRFFKKIIQSQLPSIEFRYLVRHLKSRMANLHSTAVVIERKLELARNTFQTTIDANLTEYSRKLDQLMKKFTLVAVMFIPLQLISGMWGMNCKVPFQDIDNTWPFYGITLVMVIMVVVLYTAFK